MNDDIAPAAAPEKERDHVSTLGPLQIKILKAMWSDPKLTSVQRVHDHLNENAKVAAHLTNSAPQLLAYTTYLTVLRNLARRGFVKQQNVGARAHQFVPTLTEQEYVRSLLTHIRDTVFGGSKSALSVAVAAL